MILDNFRIFAFYNVFLKENFTKMRKLQSTIFAFVSFLFILSGAYGQNRNVNKADIQFDLKAYDLAIDSYQEYLESNPDDESAMFRLAKSYEMTNDLIAAARWYEKLTSLPEHKSVYSIQYGKLLMKLGLYDKAKSQFENLTSVNKAFAKQNIQACEFAKNVLALGDRVLVSQVKGSSVNDEFGICISPDNKLIFNTFDSKFDKNASLIQNNISSVYSYDELDKRLVGYGNILNNYDGIGPVRFFGNKIVYTRNNFKNRITQISGSENDMSIYMAEIDQNGNIVNEEALPFNGTDFSAAFACFGRDADEIYFSSNKNSDNFDIFYARKTDGKWTESKKLDNNINSPGNEITPFFVNNKLYFSSDYLNGMGGDDIFSSVLYKDEYSFPINLGKGVNSPGDDLYYFAQLNSDIIYFSSNRLGSKGGLDIYSAKPLTKTYHDEVVYEYIPEAIELKNLNENKAFEISSENVKTVSAGSEDASFITLEGAKMVAYDDVIIAPSNVYFIQLASLSKNRVNSSQYKSLTKYGNIYKVQVGNYTKIRLGYFVSKDEAEAVLVSVKQNGYRDAFMVEDFLNSSKLELLESSYTFTNTNKYEKPANVGNYKIKLAAYTNPLYFDVNKVKDLGVIEQWSKGKWTIFILSGYTNYDDAQDAIVKVRNRGFATAELVMDQDGILTTVKNN